MGRERMGREGGGGAQQLLLSVSRSSLEGDSFERFLAEFEVFFMRIFGQVLAFDVIL